MRACVQTLTGPELTGFVNFIVQRAGHWRLQRGELLRQVSAGLDCDLIATWIGD